MVARALLLSICLFGMLLSAPPASGQNTNSTSFAPKWDILLLNSYDQRMTWVRGITQAFEKELQPVEQDINLFVLNMDTKRIFHQSYIDSYFRMMEQMFKDVEVDLLITADDNAFNFALKYARKLWPDVKIVFCGVNNYQTVLANRPPNTAGVVEIMSARSTVDILLKQQPQVRKLYVVNDYLTTGRAWRKAIEEQLDPFLGRLKIEYNDDISIYAIRSRIQSLDKDTAVLLGAYFGDSQGNYFTYEEAGELLTKGSPAPVYCLLAMNLASGVVGGEVISGAQQGHFAAKLVKQVLAGEDINKLPIITKEGNVLKFRYPELVRWGIDENTLPEGSMVLEKPTSLYQQYRTYFIIFFGIMGSLIIISGLQFVAIVRQRKIERELRENKRRFSVLLKNMPGMAYRGNVAPTGKLNFASDGAVDLCGYSNEELLDENFRFSDLIIEEDKEHVWDSIENQLRQKKAFEIQYRIEDRTGNIRWMWERGIQVGEQNGEAIVEGFVTDISQLKNVQAALSELNAKLAEKVRERTKELEDSIENLRSTQSQLVESEKMASLGGLVAGVAHEINTPLGTGLTSITFIEEQLHAIKTSYKEGSFKRSAFEAFMERAEEATRSAISNLNRAAGLVQNFKQVAVDQTSEAKRIIELGLYLASGLESLRPRWKHTSHNVDIEAEDPVYVESFPGALIQVLTNLVTNSLVHGFEGMEGGKIFIAVTREGDEAVIRYSDNGKGMNEEQVRKVFDPFFTTKLGKGGSGLGMHISYNLITQSMNGSITCESSPGNGVLFTIRFPGVLDDVDPAEALST